MNAIDVIRLQISSAIRHVVVEEATIPEAVEEILSIVGVYKDAVKSVDDATKDGES